ncbi:hypothetical protein, partial [Sedimenticola sp.]|uniref:hypothetical protein n=1 Tax=Sedimenticola sp. TaxID=1940285 RepID=UPI003030DDB0|nr:hypothetical protein [Sedimenticola sp.]
MMQQTTDHKPKQRWLIPVALLMIVFGVSVNLILRQAEKPSESTQPTPLISGTLIPDPRPLTPFRLTDHNGGEFSQESIKGSWHLLSFG